MDKKHEELIQFGNEELLGKGHLDVVGDIFSPDYVAHAGDKKYTGHDFIKRFIKQLRLAIPDIHLKKIEILSGSEEHITWQRSFCGTHMATLMGILPTKQKIEWRDMVVSRFDENKIAEEWVVSELLGEILLKHLK